MDEIDEELGYIKAQLGIFADHFESGSNRFDKAIYANFIYSIMASVDRLNIAVDKLSEEKWQTQ